VAPSPKQAKENAEGTKHKQNNKHETAGKQIIK
jgi:hypothetical protein